MKRILLLVLISGILLLGACGAPSETAAPLFTGGPRISFDLETAYLGQATPEQQIDYEYRFRNIGNAPLVLYSLTTKTLEGC